MGWLQRWRDRKAKREREQVAARRLSIVGVRLNEKSDDLYGVCGFCNRRFGEFWMRATSIRQCPHCLYHTSKCGQFWIATTDGRAVFQHDAVWFVRKERREKEEAKEPKKNWYGG